MVDHFLCSLTHGLQGVEVRVLPVNKIFLLKKLLFQLILYSSLVTTNINALQQRYLIAPKCFKAPAHERASPDVCIPPDPHGPVGSQHPSGTCGLHTLGLSRDLITFIGVKLVNFIGQLCKDTKS
jgi:hypothetical protein